MPNRITCITKSEPHGTLEHITHVGFTQTDGVQRYEPREVVAGWIDAGHEFIVAVGLYTAVVTTFTLNGKRYIRTRSDNTRVDNLLSLDRCGGVQLGRTG